MNKKGVIALIATAIILVNGALTVFAENDESVTQNVNFAENSVTENYNVIDIALMRRDMLKAAAAGQTQYTQQIISMLSYMIKTSMGKPAGQKPETPIPPNQTVDASEYGKEAMRLINAERKKKGLEPFKAFPELDASATTRAKEIANADWNDFNNWGYTRPNGQIWETVLNNITWWYDNGYQYSASYAVNNPAPADVVNTWFNGRSADKLNDEYSFTHFSVAYNNGKWVALFIWIPDRMKVPNEYTP